jgi:predicted ABC-type ATPase
MSKEISKRLRIFAGPNGSGKSTIIKEIQKIVTTGPYINADDIEKAAMDKGFINLGDYGLDSDEANFTAFLQRSTLLTKATEEGFLIGLSFTNNIIKVNKPTNSYAAALIAEYIRELFIENDKTFSFETVMSHESKLAILQQAHKKGYKNYLYYISTVSSDINVDRVATRVKKGGHPVEENKIRERYIRSMDLLSSMIPYCYRSFIIDNSEEHFRLILEIENGRTIKVIDDNIPAWINTHLLNKLAI